MRLAKENKSWGYDRIAGALANLGHEVADQTVGNILKRHGIPLAPERRKTTTWREFIRSHMDVLAATDFFTTEVWTQGGLVTYYVLFFMPSCPKIQTYPRPGRRDVSDERCLGWTERMVWKESSARQRLSQSQCRVGWSPPISRTPPGFELSAPFVFLDTTSSSLWKGHPSEVLGRPRGRASERLEPTQPLDSHGTCRV